MDEKQPWYVGERAMALASLLLTSRSDVRIQHQPASQADSGIDILVEILKRRSRTGRFFGVQVAGRLELLNVHAMDGNF